MKLYLMQHALAYSAEEDSERPLNPHGVDQAKATARGLKRLGLRFDLIITSPKRRAHQTAALMAESVRFPYSDILTTEAALPDQLPQGLFELLDREPADSRILVVGHQPQLSRVAGSLLRGGVVLIGNAGLTCFEIEPAGQARLVFHLPAEQLALIS